MIKGYLKGRVKVVSGRPTIVVPEKKQPKVKVVHPFLEKASLQSLPTVLISAGTAILLTMVDDTWDLIFRKTVIGLILIGVGFGIFYGREKLKPTRWPIK